MIGLVLGITTATLYLLGLRGMSDWVPQINNLLASMGKPPMTQAQVNKFLLLWPYTVAEDMIKQSKYARKYA